MHNHAQRPCWFFNKSSGCKKDDCRFVHAINSKSAIGEIHCKISQVEHNQKYMNQQLQTQNEILNQILYKISETNTSIEKRVNKMEKMIQDANIQTTKGIKKIQQQHSRNAQTIKKQIQTIASMKDTIIAALLTNTIKISNTPIGATAASPEPNATNPRDSAHGSNQYCSIVQSTINTTLQTNEDQSAHTFGTKAVNDNTSNKPNCCIATSEPFEFKFNVASLTTSLSEFAHESNKQKQFNFSQNSESIIKTEKGTNDNTLNTPNCSIATVESLEFKFNVASPESMSDRIEITTAPMTPSVHDNMEAKRPPPTCEDNIETHSTPPPSDINKTYIQSKTTAASHKAQGNHYYKEKKYKKALFEYQMAQKYDTTDPVLISNESAVFFMTKEYDKCMKCCERVIQMIPRNKLKYKIWKRMERILKINDDYDMADFYEYKRMGYEEIDKYEDCYDMRYLDEALVYLKKALELNFDKDIEGTVGWIGERKHI